MKDLTSYLQSTDLTEIDLDAIDKAISSVVENDVSEGANFDHLNFSGKTGIWSLGRDKVAPDPNEFFLVEPSYLWRGWTCWKQQKVAGKHEWLATEPQNEVAEADLADHGPYNEGAGEGWVRSTSIGMIRCETLRAVKFGTTSKSGKNALGDLLDEIRSRLHRKEPAYPIVNLGKSMFEAQGQTNTKPVFKVAVWVSMAEFKSFVNNETTLDDLVYGEGEDEPKAKGKAKAA